MSAIKYIKEEEYLTRITLIQTLCTDFLISFKKNLLIKRKEEPLKSHSVLIKEDYFIKKKLLMQHKEFKKEKLEDTFQTLKK